MTYKGYYSLSLFAPAYETIRRLDDDSIDGRERTFLTCIYVLLCRPVYGKQDWLLYFFWSLVESALFKREHRQ